MAVDKRGRKLPKGIRQRYNDFEGRFMYQGERYLVHGKTVTETQKAMTELRYKLEHGLYVVKEKITLDKWFETWIDEYKRKQVKIGTCIRYQEVYGDIIQKRMGMKHINEIRGEHIQKLYNELSDQGYSNATIKLGRAILSGCLKQAVKNKLIERNPVEIADLPRQTEKKERQAMTREQQALFMEYAKESYLHNYFEVMLRTGMRSGELRGLIYARDIDKKNKVIHVQRTLKYGNVQGYKIPQNMIVKKEYQEKVGATFFTDAPKTASSRRDIPMTAEIERCLDAQRSYWGFKVDSLDRFLFCTETGDPLSKERVQSEINRIIKRIREDGHDFPRITSHVFRHTFATRAIEAGMQPQVLKTILGHSSLAMTMDLYSHVLPDTKAQEMEKIANIF